MDKKTIATIIRSICVILGTLIFVPKLYLENIPSLCEQYADQELVSYRAAIGTNEQQYSINGIWVNESDLMESCKNG